jgi:hypothetical protein
MIKPKKLWEKILTGIMGLSLPAVDLPYRPDPAEQAV